MKAAKRIISFILCIAVFLGTVMLPPDDTVMAAGVKYIFIGDSRFCGMANAFGVQDSLTKNNGGRGTEVIRISNDIHWCSMVGTFIDEFQSRVDSVLSAYKTGSAVIIYELGANDTKNISKDIAYCNSLVDKGWTVYYCDLLPINDSGTGTIKEKDILSANSRIYSGEGKYKVIRFHDKADSRKTDSLGYHYDDATYKAWFDVIMNSVKGDISPASYAAVFNADYYLSRYADLRKAYGNNRDKAFNHFINFGIKEGRCASPAFDVNYYKNTYADLRSVYGNDNMKYVSHFLKFGSLEGRRASALFDVYSYKNYHADLRTAFGNSLPRYYEHYNNYGYQEGRAALGASTVRNAVTVSGTTDYRAVYDYYYYTERYPDIKAAYGNDDIAVLNHFIKYGMKEGRQGNSEFNLSKYKSAYADLRNAYGNDNTGYYLHYIKFGKSEGRNATR
ncbi:MAG: hypothetical protein K6E28_07725 [Eubacterium sp.]|nr:hypothetical protein [Eubacterium sp.]